MSSFASCLNVEWMIVLFLVIADGIGLVLAGMALKPAPVTISSCLIVFLLGLSCFYATVRCELRLSGLAASGALFLAYTATAGVFSYIMTALRFPLIDAWLVRADQMLGFDWLAMYGWAQAHPGVRYILICAYSSLTLQLVVLLVVLFSGQQFTRAREFFWLFVATSLGCVLVAGLLPAQGAFGHLT